MLTAASIFSGGGGSDLGAMVAGFVPIWGIDMDPVACAAYRANISEHIICAAAEDVDPTTLVKVDLLITSPPCQNYSVARSKTLPTHEQADAGYAVCHFLEVLQPRLFVLENVPMYRTAPPFLAIVATLQRLGYMYHYELLNSADYGVAQTRIRLVLRAALGALLPSLPDPVPWVGWYAAIEDLIPTLPQDRLAPWQVERLREHPMYGPLLMHTFSHSDSVASHAVAPAFTLGASAQVHRALLIPDATSHGGALIARRNECARAPTVTVTGASHPLRALLISGVDATTRQGEEPATTIMSRAGKTMAPQAMLLNGGDARSMTREEDDPSFTITAEMPRHPARPVLDGAACVRLTPRALARLMSFPDSYILPVRTKDACHILGNAVPPLLMQRLLEGMRHLLEVAA